ncbi:MAG: acyl-CoA/acyl-ACP dehydrogenase [Pseudomonadales bacterium]|nr:acyl-CoA/acyl-ACP dehydrogenase [Pseudomonadales bacterium]MCP5182598.1 acyl-CoA/acyl-ACP dehydrogenase [Pseudomonadales bacterium]
MNFDFSEDEKLVRDQTARLLADRCDSKAVREVLEGRAPYARAVWQGLCEMGLPGTAIPEAYGGVEAGYLTLCLVAQALGAAVAPTPFSSSVYLVAEAVRLFGTEAQKQSLLPKLADGSCIGALAVTEGRTEPDLNALACQVRAGRVSGNKFAVADGGIADVLLVAAGGDSGAGLYLVSTDAAGVTRSRLETVDPTRDTVSVAFSDAAAELLGDTGGQGAAQLARLYDRAAVLFAFEQIGGAQSALDMAVGYARERFAFGRPIGSFQGLKHMMADMYVALKLAESNCYYAAWALATDAPELPLAAATARVSATQAYQLCSRDNIQVHGGMGFTWEFDCHLYYRRSNYLALQLGGLSVWENKLVNALPSAA